MPVEHRCEYCDSVFKRGADLNKHRKQAQYCKKLRETEPSNTSYICVNCEQEFTRKDNLTRHQKTCNSIKNDIDQLRQEIASLVSLHKKNDRGVVMNALEPVSAEQIKEHLDDFNLDYIQGGGKGFATFADTYSFRNRVLCTDKSRKKLRYKNAAGELVEDGGGLKLAQCFFQAIAKRNEELINNEYRQIQRQVQKIAQEGKAYTSDFTDLLSKSTRLQDTLRQCKEAADGQENELTTSFIRHLTKML